MAREAETLSIRAALAAPAQLAYDHRRDANQPAQQALKHARGALRVNCPPGYKVRISGSAINLPVVPWIAILDPD